ncbi:hypothetical protein [Niveibacterium sp. SC-1]|uniref:hypothetical protein n=1 Tax=Niveibacterium sp. SC-1 TaxID=3135646 RepID=UPI00311DA5BA
MSSHQSLAAARGISEFDKQRRAQQALDNVLGRLVPVVRQPDPPDYDPGNLASRQAALADARLQAELIELRRRVRTQLDALLHREGHDVRLYARYEQAMRRIEDTTLPLARRVAVLRLLEQELDT